MKKQIFLLMIIGLCCVSHKSNGQAQTLSPGDIVVNGVASDTNVDEFSWTPLLNLNANTVIYFTDAGWNTLDQKFMGAGMSTEGLYRFIVPAGGILAGTVQTFTETTTLPGGGYTAITGTNCGDRSTGVNLPNSGDQITVFQSNVDPIASPGTFGTLGNGMTGNMRPIFSINLNNSTWTAADQPTSGYLITSVRQSVTNLVPGLTDGQNAVCVGFGAVVIGSGDETDNVRYQGITSGSKAALATAFSTLANMKRYDSNAAADFPDISLAATNWTRNGVNNYTVTGSDNIVPVCQSIVLNGSPGANSSSVTFTVTFDETVTAVSTDDFTVATTSGNATGTVSAISGSGSTYLVTVSSITGTGGFRLNLKANTNIVDAYNNGNNTNGYVAAFSTGGIHTADRDNPTVVITSPQTSPTNVASITINITFSESVTGFDINDVVVTNGSKSNFTGSGASYSLLVAPSANGSVSVAVGASVAVDGAGNNNNAATTFNISSDRTVPSVTLTSPVSNPTNSNSFVLTVTFSESVSNFLVGDITVSNASLSGFSGSGSSYTVTVTPASDGTVTANVGANVANDSANNGNTAATQFSTTIDRSQPTVSITSPQSNPTNANPITLQITFSESVSNFTQSDIVISNGTPSGFSGSGNIYSVFVTPSADGTITANIAANTANDSANNGNTAATQFSISSDRTGPTVSITSVTPAITNSSSIPVTVMFSEGVTGFVQSDLSLSNCTINSFSGSGTTYTFNVVPSSNGLVTVNIAGSVAVDAAGNNNSAATQFSRTFDNIAPAFQTPGPPPGIVNFSPYTENITLTEASTDFTSADIQITNGTLNSFSGSGTSYSVSVMPTANGTVTVSVAAGTFHDAAGNANTATLTRNTLYDNVSPTVSINSLTSNPTNVSSIPVTVMFSESVANFLSSDVAVGNGNLNSFSGSGTTYTFNIVPVSNGTVTVDIAAGVANDQASNPNTAAAQFSRVVDNVQPTVVISSSTSNPTNSGSIPITVTFSESVVNFLSSDVTVSNGTVNFFSGSETTYTFNIVPDSNGTVTINVAAGVANDLANNGNAAAAQFSRVYDNVQPSVSITSPASSPTNAASFTVNFTFSKSVINFESTDVSVTNGSLSGFSGSGTNYSATLTPTSDGTVTVNIAASVANDAAGNTNTAATQFSIVSDKNGPTVTITSSASNPTNLNSIPLTFTFSESVADFIASDVFVSGGTLSGFTGSGTTYTGSLAPSGDGTINVFVFGNVATDAGGNGNTVGTFTIISDRTKPTVSITSTESTPTSANPIPITFTFSESTSNFVVTDITVTGGTLTNFSGNGNTYTVGLIPSGNGNKTVRLLANVMSDAAGNTNNASATFSIFYVTPCSQTTTWNGFFWTNGDPVPTQPAVIAADYESYYNPGGFSACTLIIGNNAQVTINPGDNLSISGNLTVQAGSKLTFQNSSSITVGGNIAAPADGLAIVFESGSNLIQNGVSNNNSGSISYKRATTIRRLDYTYWSSPVGGQNLKLFSPQTVSPPVGASRFYVINEATNAFAAVDPLVTNFEAAKGYMLRAPNDFNNTPALWTGTFTGIPNNGNYDISAPVTNIGSNLVGNPYPSTISADLFLATNPGTLYFYTHSNTSPTNSGSYATYTTFGPTVGASGELPNGFIQAGQGFVYQPAATTTAHFTNSMRQVNNENQFFRNPMSKHRLWLNLTNETGFINQILVGYMEGATDGNDISLDGKSRVIGTSISSVIGVENYAVQARPTFSENDTVSLNFIATADGTYSLSLDHFDGLFLEGQHIFLKDNLTGTVHDLKESSYNFSTTAGQFADRFSIVYQSTLGLQNPKVDQNSIIIYNENGILKINSGAALMSDVKLFDIRGRLLFESKNINASTAILKGFPDAKQLLIVQVTADNTMITKKVIY